MQDYFLSKIGRIVSRPPVRAEITYVTPSGYTTTLSTGEGIPVIVALPLMEIAHTDPASASTSGANPSFHP